MNKIEIKKVKAAVPKEQQVVLELRTLIGFWDHQLKKRKTKSAGRLVPVHFDQYFQTHPICLN